MFHTFRKYRVRVDPESFLGTLGMRREYGLDGGHQQFAGHHEHTHTDMDLHPGAIYRSPVLYQQVFGSWEETLSFSSVHMLT